MSLSSMINNSHLIKRIPATHHIIYRIILKMIDIVTYEMRFNNIVPIYKTDQIKGARECLHHLQRQISSRRHTAI